MSQVRPMIRNLAGYVSQLAQETNQQLNNVNRQIDAQNDIITALIRVIGEEQVQDAVKALRAERQKAMEDQQDIATKKLVDGGALTIIEAVTSECLIVGTDKFKDGRERKVRFEMEFISPEQAAKFVGKKVGETVVNEEAGVTFTVSEIYTIDKAKVEAILAPKPGLTDAATGPDNAPEELVNSDGTKDSPPGGGKKSGKKNRKAKA